MAVLLVSAGCGAAAPTVEDLRVAYAEHVKRDRVHERGLGAREAPVVIPQQEPRCSADGNAHFDCRLRVIYESDKGRRSEEQLIHVRRERGSWIVDSID